MSGAKWYFLKCNGVRWKKEKLDKTRGQNSSTKTYFDKNDSQKVYVLQISVRLRWLCSFDMISLLGKLASKKPAHINLFLLIK